jgi:hypothetical protein
VDRCCFWVFEGGERVEMGWMHWILEFGWLATQNRTGVCFLNFFFFFFFGLPACMRGWVGG